MKQRLIALAFIMAFMGQAGVCADPPADPGAGANPSKDTKAEPGKDNSPKQPDPFDFGAQKKRASEEQQYIQVDETLKVVVDPVVHNAVVDRVVEQSTVFLKAPGVVRVEYYLQAVDGPYCGKPVGEPRLLGRSQDGRTNFAVAWNRPEMHKYVKVYALAFKRQRQSSSRSRSIDLSMGGDRYQPPPPPPPSPSTGSGNEARLPIK